MSNNNSPRRGRVAGHGLMNEGWPYLNAYTQGGSRTGFGMAKCQCGELSAPLFSLAARKRWHVEHKIKIMFPVDESDASTKARNPDKD